MTWKVTADMRQTGQVHTVVAFSSSALTSDEIRRFRVNRRIDIVVSLSEHRKEKSHRLRRSQRPHLVRADAILVFDGELAAS